MLNFHRPLRLLACAVLGLAACTQAALAFTIDDFSDGRVMLEWPNLPLSPDGWLRADTAASVPGGWRSLALQPQAGAPALTFIGVNASGLQAYRVANQQLYVSFGYGQTEPMNLDLGDAAALRLDMLWGGGQYQAAGWNPDALSVTVYATTSNGAGFNPNGSAMTAILHGAQDVHLPLSSFTVNSATGVGVNWADVDSLLFVVSEAAVGLEAAGFGILSVSTLPAVPEPATSALLAAGIAALGSLRRVRRRAALAAAALLAAGSASAADIVNIQGFGASGAGANIFSYPVAPGTLVDLFNPVLVNLPAGTYDLADAWGQPGALYDTWNFEQSAPGSWASHYVAAEVLPGGGYRLLVDGVSLLDPSCQNHFCAWDTQAQAAAAFLATPAYRFTLAQAATVAFASADYFLLDNLGGISLSITPVPVPEPAGWALLLAGLLAGVGVRRNLQAP